MTALLVCSHLLLLLLLLLRLRLLRLRLSLRNIEERVSRGHRPMLLLLQLKLLLLLPLLLRRRLHLLYIAKNEKHVRMNG